MSLLGIAKNASSCTLNGMGLSVYEKLNKFTYTVCDLLWLAGACQGTKLSIYWKRWAVIQVVMKVKAVLIVLEV